MIDSSKLFGNFFNSNEITPARLILFGNDAIAKLTAQNPGSVFDSIIADCQTDINTLQSEVGDVDVTLSTQKGKTMNLDAVISLFKKIMSDKEGRIADDLNGRNTAAYLAFYPHGITEYSAATKTELPVLLARVRNAAETYTAQIGATLAGTLIAFETDFNTAREQQETIKGTLEGDRIERDTAYTNAQLTMLKAIHRVAQVFPGDVEKCNSYFDFSLLFANKHSAKVTKSGVIAAAQAVVVLNQTLTDSFKLKVKNTDDNAEFSVYLAATATLSGSETGIAIKPGKTKNIKPSQLGDLNNTFLIFKNNNLVNEGSWVLEIIK